MVGRLEARSGSWWSVGDVRGVPLVLPGAGPSGTAATGDGTLACRWPRRRGRGGIACPNPEASEGAEQARVGATVEVFAEVESVADDRVALSVCGSPDLSVEAAD